MNIALMAVDSNYPNLALMKISAWHKAHGDNVEWYNPFDNFDKLYMAKIFTFSPDYLQYINNTKEIEKGGTGYDIYHKLDNCIDMMQPDYDLYPNIERNLSYGFITRGCINKCKWCVVPQKEGNIHPYMDIDDITVNGLRSHAILMDNNVLACSYGISQIQKNVDKKYHVDFNQGLDARLVTPEIAKLLAKVKWIKRIRFGCDTPAQIKECEKAIDLIRSAGYHGEFFLYCIIMDFYESYKRISYWRHDKKVLPFAQPYRSLNKNNIVPQWQKDLAHWCNRKEIFSKCSFEEYIPRKGFCCSEYFE